MAVKRIWFVYLTKSKSICSKPIKFSVDAERLKKQFNYNNPGQVDVGYGELVDGKIVNPIFKDKEVGNE